MSLACFSQKFSVWASYIKLVTFQKVTSTFFHNSRTVTCTALCSFNFKYNTSVKVPKIFSGFCFLISHAVPSFLKLPLPLQTSYSGCFWWCHLSNSLTEPLRTSLFWHNCIESRMETQLLSTEKLCLSWTDLSFNISDTTLMKLSNHIAWLLVHYQMTSLRSVFNCNHSSHPLASYVFSLPFCLAAEDAFQTQFLQVEFFSWALSLDLAMLL